MTSTLITISGGDSPGITAEMTGILAKASCPILDIAQAVIHGLLSLSILFESNDPSPVLKDLLFRATEMGLKLDYQIFSEVLPSPTQTGPRPCRYVLTLIAERITAQALYGVTRVLGLAQVNIDEITRLSEGSLSCVELLVSTRAELNRHELKQKLLPLASQQKVDIALQPEGLYRRAKRLIVFDMDSTLIQNEVIDEFAREMGIFESVSQITATAMQGGLDYDESLIQRVALLRGLTQAQIDSVTARLEITPGAIELIDTLKRLGYRIALISGGFTCVTELFKARLGIDFAYANTLELKSGVATGRVLPPIVNAQRKADLLDVIAQQEGILLDQVIAIGDGANDVLMIEKAGLGIAFNAKSIVREKADLSLNQNNLRSILYLLGISGRDLNEATLS